jgi:hypothetical protein
MPDGSVKCAGIFGIGAEIDGSGEIVFVQGFLPSFAAVGGFVNAASSARRSDG